MIFIEGLLAGLLAAALIVNLVQYRTAHSAIESALQHETRLLDRARAAELRAGEQIDAMLDRISTTPRLEVRSASYSTSITDTRKYIADHPADDEAWNEFRGESDEDSELT